MPKNKGTELSQHLRLFVPHVFDMANGTCLKSAEATLNKVLTVNLQVYHADVIRDNSIFLSWL